MKVGQAVLELLIKTAWPTFIFQKGKSLIKTAWPTKISQPFLSSFDTDNIFFKMKRMYII